MVPSPQFTKNHDSSRTRWSHPWRLTKLPLPAGSHRPFAVLALMLSLTAPSFAEADKEESKGFFKKDATSVSDFQLFTEGSTLKDVSFPSYEQGFIPKTLVKAAHIKVVSEYEIVARDIVVDMLTPNAEVEFRAELDSGTYDERTGLLRSSDPTTLTSANLQAVGSGLVIELETERCFLVGPAHTTYTSEEKKIMNHSSLKTPGRALAASLVASSSLLAAPPNALDQQQLAELDKQTQSEQKVINAADKDAQKKIQQNQKQQQQSTENVDGFLDKIGHAEASQPAAEKTTKPAEKNAAAEDSKFQTTGLKIASSGGIYFDSNDGLLVYLKEVELTEERFRLTCTKELKAFIGPKVVEEEKPNKKAAGKKSNKKKPAAEKPAEQKTGETEKKPDQQLGDLEKIIALGDVFIEVYDVSALGLANDEPQVKGKRLAVYAEQAVYDTKKEEIILRGGYPKVEYGNNHLIAKEPNLYVTITMDKNGQAKFVAEPGKWETFVKDIPKNDNQ